LVITGAAASAHQRGTAWRTAYRFSALAISICFATATVAMVF
jgi:hypothetical protein